MQDTLPVSKNSQGIKLHHATVLHNFNAVQFAIDVALDRFKIAARAEELVHLLGTHGAAAECRIAHHLGELFWLIDNVQAADALQCAKYRGQSRLA